MSWINQHRALQHGIMLVLMLIAILGPWTYSPDGAPPVAWCRPPFRQFNNRCVKLVSGATVLSYMGPVLRDLCTALTTKSINLADGIREILYITAVCLIVLPLISHLLSIFQRESRDPYVFRIIAWGLAILPVLYLAISDLGKLHTALWGILLYIALAALNLASDIRGLLSASQSS